MPFNDARYRQFDRTGMPVAALAEDYLDGHVTPWHSHPNAQLIHAVRGIMVVSTAGGQWIVPPARGLWIPPGIRHSIRMVGEVLMRTAYIRPEAAPALPDHGQVLEIAPLLRELIVAAIALPLPYASDSHAGRLAQLLLDELQRMPTLPLFLPMPAEARLRTICDAIAHAPDDSSTVSDWAGRLAVDPKTIQRLFLRETGMTFGQWRTQARLLMALERLAAGEKIVTVALGLGYDSPSAFATMFKRQFGVAPSRFFQ